MKSMYRDFVSLFNSSLMDLNESIDRQKIVVGAVISLLIGIEIASFSHSSLHYSYHIRRNMHMYIHVLKGSLYSVIDDTNMYVPWDHEDHSSKAE